MKKLVTIVVLGLLAQFAWNDLGLGERFGIAPSSSGSTISQAYERRQSDLQVEGEGKVIKVLADDNKGSKHQRFLLRMDSGQTLLVAHNIDLAPRLAGLRAGDSVAFFGEYEWNEKGGVIHWTHHDPRGAHPAGWLKYQGRTYQ